MFPSAPFAVRRLGRLILVSVVLGGLFSSGRGWAQEPVEKWTLERCLSHAASNAPEVLKSLQEVQKARLGVDDARVRFLPDVDIQVAYDPFADESNRAFIGQLFVSDILKGYTKFFEGRLAEIQHLISQLNLERTKAWLEFKVTQLYLRLLAGVKGAQLAEELGGLIREQEATIKTLLKQGLTSPLDARRVSLTVSRQELALQERRDENNILARKLKALIGLRPDDRFSIDAGQSLSDVQPAATETDDRQLDLEMAKLKLKALNEQKKLLKYERWPAPVVAAGWSEHSPQWEDGLYAIIGVTIPLYTAGRQGRRLARQNLAVENQGREIEILKQQLDIRRAELDKAQARLRRRLRLTQETAALAQDEVQIAAEKLAQAKEGPLYYLEKRIEAKRQEMEVLKVELELALNRASVRTLAKVTLP